MRPCFVAAIVPPICTSLKSTILASIVWSMVSTIVRVPLCLRQSVPISFLRHGQANFVFGRIQSQMHVNVLKW